MSSISGQGPRAAAVVRFTLLLVGILSGCSTWPPDECRATAPEHRTDFVIVTIIDAEYRAMLRWVDEPHAMAYRNDRWTVGTLRGEYGERSAPRIVVVGASAQGQVSSALTTSSAIDYWRPAFVVLVGIAGGIEEFVSLGDLIIATTLWDYDIGHLGAAFEPATRYIEPDEALLRAARRVPADWARGIEQKPPTKGVVPNVIEGRVASGDKLIETSQSAFFQELQRADPDFVAVEMEGAGSAAAVARADVSKQPTGFLMIRGISDLVGTTALATTDSARALRNPQRARWREFAADVAATFAAALIRQQWEPAAP